MYLIVQVREIGPFFPCPTILTRKNVRGMHFEPIVVLLVYAQSGPFNRVNWGVF
jgi:hypothetical protein